MHDKSHILPQIASPSGLQARLAAAGTHAASIGSDAADAFHQAIATALVGATRSDARTIPTREPRSNASSPSPADVSNGVRGNAAAASRGSAVSDANGTAPSISPGKVTVATHRVGVIDTSGGAAIDAPVSATGDRRRNATIRVPDTTVALADSTAPIDPHAANTTTPRTGTRGNAAIDRRSNAIIRSPDTAADSPATIHPQVASTDTHGIATSGSLVTTTTAPASNTTAATPGVVAPVPHVDTTIGSHGIPASGSQGSRSANPISNPATRSSGTPTIALPIEPRSGAPHNAVAAPHGTPPNNHPAAADPVAAAGDDRRGIATPAPVDDTSHDAVVATQLPVTPLAPVTEPGGAAGPAAPTRTIDAPISAGGAALPARGHRPARAAASVIDAVLPQPALLPAAAPTPAATSPAGPQRVAAPPTATHDTAARVRTAALPTPRPEPVVPLAIRDTATLPTRAVPLDPSPDAAPPAAPPLAAAAGATAAAVDANAPTRAQAPIALPAPAATPAAASPTPSRRGGPVASPATAAVDTIRATVAATAPATGPAPAAAAATSATGAGSPADAAATTPAAQVAHVLIGLPVAGNHRVTVQLSPGELGRVQISVERSADGTATINVTAERPETLALIQGNTAQLHAALDRAGVGSHGRTLQFALAPEITIESASGSEAIRKAIDTPASTLADAIRAGPAADQAARAADAPARTHAPDASATPNAGAQGGTEHFGEGRRNADPGANGGNPPRHRPAGGMPGPDRGTFIAADTPGVRRMAARAGIDITA